jgi:TolB-like protein
MKARVIIGALLALFLPTGHSLAKIPVKVAILPFQVHSAEDLGYLQRGVQEMLFTRIASEGEVQVLDRETVEEASADVVANLNDKSVLELGKRIQADYVVFGSITKIGNHISIDGILADIKKEEAAARFSSSSKGMDEVIPKVNEFAKEIRGKILGERQVAVKSPSIPSERPEVPAGVVAPPPPDSSSPDLGPMPPPQREESIFVEDDSTDQQQSGKSSMNPAFVVSYQDYKNRGYRKSPELVLKGIVGVDIGDTDGDGANETILIDDKTVLVTKDVMHEMGSRKIISGLTMDHYLSVDVADLNNNRIAEIYVTNIVKGEMYSFVLEYRQGEYRRIASKLPWFLKVVESPEKGRMILGQEKLIRPVVDKISDDIISIFGDTYELAWKRGKLEPVQKVPIPDGINILGMNYADVDRDGVAEIVAFDDREFLVLYSPKGKLQWTSDRPYGGTNRYFTKNFGRDISPFEEPPADTSYIPLRIMIADTDENGLSEVMVSMNSQPQSILYGKLYNKGSLLNLSWDGMDLVKNWQTREMKGYIADYQVKDIDNDGKQELIIALRIWTGVSDYLKSRSTVVAYELRAK